MLRALLALILALAAVGAPARAAAPSVPGVDAPELAKLGPYGVGLKRIELVQPGQADLTRLDAKTGAAPLVDRHLPVSLWYPATPAPGAATVRYHGGLTPERADQPPVPIDAEGIAVEDAPAVKGQGFPLVILSHGYGGAPEAMTWLAENLASKGYVVAAIAHRDPAYGDPRGFSGPLLRRPLDIAFVARSLQAEILAGRGPLAGVADPDRIALIGYSMGGYGVLTEAAGGFDAAGAPAKVLPPAYVGPYLPGGALREQATLSGVKAVVAISPFTRAPAGPVLSEPTLAALRTPLLMIAGDQDRTVGFEGVKTTFDQAVHAPRRLLVFREAGHSLGMNPAADADRSGLWALDWFEDPVWRKDRTLAIEQHFISAFLDRWVKGDLTRDAYLNVAEPISDHAVWPQAGAYGAYSPGAAPITVWKGFQRVHSAGLELWSGEVGR
ncbi:alpha/beta hydrolase family protein [Phenylobacterium montanum]|uniref:Dienelactone hydrolase n=1 Tax=Phenylobacterium montanum TaxID=2823693 RepID=A0A975IUM0_9CAUL|nr:dienelactone hydrolase [Caulobacter sp. S6]QUD87885.1 dienelactone hydrolase [Caulobacter sp. S6]